MWQYRLEELRCIEVIHRVVLIALISARVYLLLVLIELQNLHLQIGLLLFYLHILYELFNFVDELFAKVYFLQLLSVLMKYFQKVLDILVVWVVEGFLHYCEDGIVTVSI